MRLKTDNIVPINQEDMVYRHPQKETEKKTKRYFDYSLILVVVFLLLFGLLMVHSATSYKSGNYYIKRQLIADGIGIVAMLFVTFFKFKWIDVLTPYVYIVSVLALFLVLIPSIAVTAGNATRWIKIYGGFQLQPAEITKIGVILVVSSLVTHMGRGINTWKAMAIVTLVVFIPAAIIYKVNDNMSTAIIVAAIGSVIYLISCSDAKKILTYIGVMLAAASGLAYYVYRQVIAEIPFTDKPMRIQRIIAWLHPEEHASDKAYQTIQALYAIGSGGIMGKGLGEGIQKMDNIPEIQNDMIFSVVCEELGLFGAFAILTLYIILIWRCLVIANNANTIFESLVVVGVMTHFSIQVILNVAVVTNTIVNTGVSLPFISYGGSSAIFLLAEVGLVLNVARNIRTEVN